MKRVHLIGIGGTGLSAIARVLLESGYTVSGSDRALSPLAHSLEAAGARVFIGHKAENVAGADLVVRSSAVPDDNPEVLAAQAAGIPVLKRADFLGELMAGKLGIAVGGTHGKTTTSAMIAWMLTALGQEPSFIVGGVLKNLGSNAHAGKGPAFVVEADEYDRMFLGLRPQIIVVTNLEYDHPDCFPTPADYRAAFEAFAARLAPGGTLLACLEDPGAAALLESAKAKGSCTRSYGQSTQSDYQARDVQPNSLGGFTFEAFYRPSTAEALPLGKVALQVPGLHNVRNALAALAVAHLLDLPLEAATNALGAFSGSGRRFEVRGEPVGITVIDDYAHHPTEIKTTLSAARSRYPARRLWAVWQPHTYSRTRSLEAEFAGAFSEADQVVISEIYAAREPAQEYSAARVAARMAHPAVHFIPTLAEIEAFLLRELRPGDVLLVFSAGDADQISTHLLASLPERSR